MTSLILLTTHLVAFLAGGLTVRWLIPHFLNIREVDGHSAIEFTRGGRYVPGTKTETTRSPRGIAAVILVASLVVVGIGVQGILAARDNAHRDAADRDYADCLTQFAADLVETLENRSDATVRLAAAKDAKDAAESHVFRLAYLASQDPKPTDQAAFTRALAAVVKATDKYDRVVAETTEVRQRNPFEAPAAVCER